MDKTTHHFDAIVIGGGIAGLWLLSLLRRKGYEAILLEKDGLGCRQTLASQGMIHGGVKYSLAGALTGASETIADMPARWQSCLEGKGEIDLSGVTQLSDAYYMFSDARVSSKITAFFGSKAIEGRVTTVAKPEFPEAFKSPEFGGLLYKLKDLVLNTHSLIEQLHQQNAEYIYQGAPNFEHTNNQISKIHLPGGLSLSAKSYVLAAGSGNQDLINNLELNVPTQLRPLHQVMIKHEKLPDLFAHAVTLKAADKPRITFTTHKTATSKIWYLGGQLAETGVARSAAEQIKFAREELNDVLPWIDFSDCEFSTFRVDRAEPKQDTLLRPDTPYVTRQKEVVVCWPSKLTLAPMMGDMFMKVMPEPSATRVAPLNLPRATVGTPPWA